MEFIPVVPGELLFVATADGYLGPDRRLVKVDSGVERRRVEVAVDVSGDSNPQTTDVLPALDIAINISKVMTRASENYLDAIHAAPTIEPATELERRTTITTHPLTEETTLLENYTLIGGWRPGKVFEIASDDPYQRLNPSKVIAISGLIKVTMQLANMVGATKHPDLTYLNNQRATAGRTVTTLTKQIMNIHPSIRDWVTNLPKAERLRPVAHPWSDTSTIITKDGRSFIEIPMYPELQALMGGPTDGRGVREREAWERLMLDEIRYLLVPKIERDGALVLTSLGTGTSEPIVDTGVQFMDKMYGNTGPGTIVNGYDLNRKSLAVASFLASQKTPHQTGRLQFNGFAVNILQRDGLNEAIAGKSGHVNEAIGLAEYIPSANAPTPEEREQRRSMEEKGCLSAEEFYGQIYRDMPRGSVLLTGNMRDDSPEGLFVREGLGWGGIIQRGTKEYLEILRRGGIPGEAVQLYVPGKDSSGVYNLVLIRKL